MHPTDKAARVAGAVYLLLVLTAPLRLLFIPGTLFVTGNATATAANISAHELLFRFGIFADLLTGTITLFVTLALYRLFADVDRNLALLMVILGGLMVTPIYFVNTMNDAGALLLARGGDFLAVLAEPQRNALCVLFLRLHHYGVLANEMFWGLWLLPLAALILKSRSVPRFLGIWLIINGAAYVLDCFTGIVLPKYEDIESTIIFPAQLGEVAFVLWLLIKGARVPPATETAESRG